MIKAISAVLTLGILCAVPALARADSPGPDWMKKADLERHMRREGYSAIVVGADDGHWEGEAVKNGRIIEFHADAHTGKITKSEPKTAY